MVDSQASAAVVEECVAGSAELVVEGDRACIGSRKMSANAAATGMRHAQAVIASAWVGGGLAKAEKKIVPRAATPIALESCCTASSTPEAEPTSSIPTPARMNSNSCPMYIPAPAPAGN